MTAAASTGIGLTLMAGLLSGNCMLPMKFVKRWAWENTWLVFSVVSLVLLPGLLAVVLVDDLRAVYASLPASAFVPPLLFGLGWGIAQVLFGLSVARLGLALGYAIIVGLSSLLGTLVPLFTQHLAVAGSSQGALILAGVFVMVTGIVVSAWAGRLRERAAAAMTRGAGYGGALCLAILCGLLAPMLNYSFAFGQPIAEAAVQLGTSRESAGYAVWPVGLLGGLLPNTGYSIYLLTRNRTWKNFQGSWWPDAAPGVLMGFLWMGAMAVYGVSAVYLGDLGTSVGWALFQIFMIMTANLSGVLTGEWRQAGSAARKILWAGLGLLAAATILIAAANH